MQRPCHQFLASAGFTIDQHSDVGVRKPADGAKYLLHGRGLADDLGLGQQPGFGLVAALSRAWASARSVIATTSSRSKGLGGYSNAPRW